MRIRLITIFIFLLLFGGCVIEPMRTFYDFKFINKSEDTLYVYYECFSHLPISDTLIPGKEIQVYNCELGSYKNYNTNLIVHFFKSLEIKTKGKKVIKDPFVSENWEWPVGLIENGPQKNQIEFIFNFTIIDSDI